MGDNATPPSPSDISSLPLGNILQIKQQGRARATKHKKLVRKLLDRGFGKG